VIATGSTLTKKQKEMTKARSPKNFNMTNDSEGLSAQKGFSKGLEDFTQQQQEWQPVIDPHTDSGAAKPKDNTAKGKEKADETESLRQTVQQNVKNLGVFGLQVQAKVNNFLNKGKGLMGSTGNVTAGWNPETKSWGLKDNMQADIQELTKSKQVEQGEMSQLLDEWYDMESRGKPISFVEGLEREAQRLAQHYPDVVKKQNYLLGLADRLQMLEDQGLGNSAEARALRHSIMLEDDQGLVQLIYDANKEYKKNVLGEKGEGLTWSGDGFTEFSAKDFVSLSADELAKEIQNTAVGALGIFSGDYAVNLKRQLDEMRNEYLKSGQEEVKRNQEFTRLAEDYLENWGDTMGGEATAIQKDFSDAIDDLEKRILAYNGVSPGTGGAITLPNGTQYNVGREGERGSVARAYLEDA